LFSIVPSLMLIQIIVYAAARVASSAAADYRSRSVVRTVASRLTRGTSPGKLAAVRSTIDVEPLRGLTAEDPA
jgi:hypothetical protein